MTSLACPSCPQCGAAAGALHAFCSRCGKSLPSTASGNPSVEAGDGGAPPVNRSASTALLAVAILQTLAMAAVVITAYAQVQRHAAVEFQPLGLAVLGGVAALYFALAAWARRSPLPAAVVGLAVFLALHGTEAARDPASLPEGFAFKLLIALVLVGAVLVARRRS